jgi:CelD/BcsL family acetyltransferase involved in cellulose biosynthesis
MRVQSVSTYEHWQEFAGSWNLLTRGIPFRGWEWLSTWWRHYGTHGELMVLVVLDERGTLVGAAPWYIEQAGTRGRIVRMIGSGEVCSDYPTLLCTPESEDLVAEAVGKWLIDEGAMLRWDVLEMDCVPSTDSVMKKLMEHLENAGCLVMKTPGHNLWQITLPATWKEYLAQLSKSHRKQISRLLREYCDTGRARLEIAQSRAELHRAMDLLMNLHQRRWQIAGESGVFSSERFTNFLHDVAIELQNSQILKLSVLELNGVPAAVDFHLVNATTNFVYQGGIEPDLLPESPGKLLTALLIQEAIVSGRQSFDFLRGDEPYKPHFRAIPIETTNFHIVPKRAGAQLRHGLWMTGLAVKSLVKSGLSLAGRS